MLRLDPVIVTFVKDTDDRRAYFNQLSTGMWYCGVHLLYSIPVKLDFFLPSILTSTSSLPEARNLTCSAWINSCNKPISTYISYLFIQVKKKYRVMRGKLKINHNHTFSLSPISSSVLFSTILFPLYKKHLYFGWGACTGRDCSSKKNRGAFKNHGFESQKPTTL